MEALMSESEQTFFPASPKDAADDSFSSNDDDQHAVPSAVSVPDITVSEISVPNNTGLDLRVPNISVPKLTITNASDHNSRLQEFILPGSNSPEFTRESVDQNCEMKSLDCDLENISTHPVTLGPDTDGDLIAVPIAQNITNDTRILPMNSRMKNISQVKKTAGRRDGTHEQIDRNSGSDSNMKVFIKTKPVSKRENNNVANQPSTSHTSSKTTTVGEPGISLLQVKISSIPSATILGPAESMSDASPTCIPQESLSKCSFAKNSKTSTKSVKPGTIKKQFIETNSNGQTENITSRNCSEQVDKKQVLNTGKRKHMQPQVLSVKKQVIEIDGHRNTIIMKNGQPLVPATAGNNLVLLPQATQASVNRSQNCGATSIAIPMYLIINNNDPGSKPSISLTLPGGVSGLNATLPEQNKHPRNNEEQEKSPNSPLQYSAHCQTKSGEISSRRQNDIEEDHQTFTCLDLSTKVCETESRPASVESVTNGKFAKLKKWMDLKTRLRPVKTESDLETLEIQTSVNHTDLGGVEVGRGGKDLETYTATAINLPMDKNRNLSKKMDSLKFPPCVICGGEASGFHYGCNTCEACKNFYRRCLLRKNGVNFFCSQGKNCEISHTKNKSNCSSCRYTKCLALGMSKEKCKMGRYTYTRRTETINQVRKLEGKDVNDRSSMGSLPCSSSESNSPESCTINEYNCEDVYSKSISKNIRTVQSTPQVDGMDKDELIQHLVDAIEAIKPYGDFWNDAEIEERCRQHHTNYMLKVKTFGLGKVSMEEYHNLLRNYGIDIDNSWEQFKTCAMDYDPMISRYCNFAKQIPEFAKLNYEDQSTLLKTTNPTFFLILMHKGYVPKYNVFLEINGQAFHVDEAADRFYTRSFVDYTIDLMTRIQMLNLTAQEMALLCSISTMSGDQCELKSPEIVDSIQLQLTTILQQELVRNYGHTAGLNRFTKFIDCLITMRDYSSVYQKEYKAMCADPLIRSEIPNMDILLPDDV